MDIKSLERQHRAIIATIDELCASTDKPVDEGFPSTANVRLKLAKVVADNMATETAEIHEPLQARDLTSRVPEYAAIATRTRELRLVFSAHITKWSTDAIKRDWAGHGRSIRHITSELADILHREERCLFPVVQTLLTNDRQDR